MASKSPVISKARGNRYAKTARQARILPAGWHMHVLKAVSAAAAIGLMSLLFVFGHDWLTRCEYFRADKVEISGGERTGKRQIMEAARVSEGVNVLSVNLATARRRLLSLAWVSQAQVSRRLPDTLIIKVSEHEPAAVIELGRKFLLNGEGEIFMEAPEEGFNELPLVTGLDYRDWKSEKGGNEKLSDSVNFVIRRAMAENSVIPAENIKRISVDRELGLTLKTKDFPAYTIHLGLGGYERKYARLSKIFSYLRQRGASLAFEEIDLRFPDRIVARPAEEESSLTTRQKEA